MKLFFTTKLTSLSTRLDQVLFLNFFNFGFEFNCGIQWVSSGFLTLYLTNSLHALHTARAQYVFVRWKNKEGFAEWVINILCNWLSGCIVYWGLFLVLCLPPTWAFPGLRDLSPGQSPSSSAGDGRSIVIAMGFLGSPDIPQPASMSALLTFVSRPRGQADYLDAQASERDGNDETWKFFTLCSSDGWQDNQSKWDAASSRLYLVQLHFSFPWRSLGFPPRIW